MGKYNSKQILDVHQMQHLQELGLKLKPSLIHYYKIINIDSGKWYLSVTTGDISEDSPTYQYIPAYTLQDVLGALPKEIKYKEKICWLSFEISDEHIGYYYNDYLFRPTWVFDERLRVIDESIIDAAYKLLCRCIENGYVETNKNE